ncbi:MAG: presqualene diphosphate synthase HpnD [Magnetococcales bacterium]|nr:presqualene diphosphate synthase HpnD [Magnetococcales bacterium]
MTPADYCQEVTRRSGSSFYHALRLFPKVRRRGMHALYAFCRSVDDIVDCCQNTDMARIELAWWREEMERTFAGVPQHPIAQELVWAQTVFALEPEPFFAILDGMAMDLVGQRYPGMAELELYCSKVAVAVGQVALRLLGVAHSPLAGQFAHHLGVALQLTNILRDLAEDARMGRIYLPLEMLQRAGIAPDRVLAGHWLPELQGVLEQVAEAAAAHFQHADRLATEIGRREVRSALAMGAVYRHYLSCLQKCGCNVFDHPVRVGRLTRMWMTWQAWVSATTSSCRVRADFPQTPPTG